MQSFFVSSTFKDMQGERDALHRLVMPQLRDMAAEYGESIQFVDLRWGISTTDLDSDAGAKKILGVCLSEIRQCEPYMIVLLGERYGWMPPPELLRDAAEEMDFPAESYEMSVTELEIQYGIYLAENQLDHCIFCLRDPVPSEGLSEELRNIYLPGSDADRQRMERLKEKILKTSGSVIIRYGLDWDTEKGDFTGYESFAEQLAGAIEKMLRQQWQDRRALTWQERQREEDALLISMHQSTFVGRTRELMDMLDALRTHRVLILEGEGGCGKSALMAQLCRTVHIDGYTAEMFCCGNSANCMNAVQLLRLLCWQLMQLDAQNYLVSLNSSGGTAELALRLADGEGSPGDIRYSDEEWRDIYRLLMRKYSGPPVVFFLDAIDQLVPDTALYESWFIPEQIPEQCRLVISTAGSVRVNPMAIPQGAGAIPSMTMRLSPPEREELRGILKVRLASEHKQVSKAVEDKLLENPCSKNMLGMEIMIRRLVMLGQADFREIAELEKTMDGAAAIDTYLIKLVGGFSTDLNTLIIKYIDTVVRSLGGEHRDAMLFFPYIIALMQHGISAGELERLAQCVKTDDVFESIPDRHPWKNFWDPILFARLKRYLGNLLIQRADGRVDFSHRSLREALQRMDGVNFIAVVLRYWLYYEPRESISRQENILVSSRMVQDFDLENGGGHDPGAIRNFFDDAISDAFELENSDDPQEAAGGKRQMEILKLSVLNDLNGKQGWAHLESYISILDELIGDGDHANGYAVWFFGKIIAIELGNQGGREKAMAAELLYGIISALQRQKERLDAGTEERAKPWDRAAIDFFLNYHIRCLRFLSGLQMSMQLGLLRLSEDYGCSPEFLLKSGTAAAEEGMRLYPDIPIYRWQRASLYGYLAKLKAAESAGKSEEYARRSFQYAMDSFKVPVSTGNPEEDYFWEKKSAGWLMYDGAQCMEALSDLCMGCPSERERLLGLAEEMQREIKIALDRAWAKPEALDVTDVSRFMSAVYGCAELKAVMYPGKAPEIRAEAADFCGEYYFRLRQDGERCAAPDPEPRERMAMLGMDLGELLLYNTVPRCMREAGYDRASAIRFITANEGGYIQAQSRSDYQSRLRYAQLLCMEALLCFDENPERCRESSEMALGILNQFRESSDRPLPLSIRYGRHWLDKYTKFANGLLKGW